MPTTFRRTATDSDLGGGLDFNKAILLPGSDTTGPQTITLGNTETRTSRGFTAAGVPGADGVTGDYTVEMAVAVGNTNVELRVTLHRINSAGTIQTSSAQSAAQVASAGVHTFTFTSQVLGTWVSGDRLRVDYTYTNIAHGGQSFDAAHGGTDNEVIAPWTTAAEPHALTGTIAGTGTLSGTAGIRRVLTGSVAGVGTLAGTLDVVGGPLELTGSVSGTGTLAGTLTIVDTGFDPADLVVNINGTTAELSWTASGTAGVVDYQVFRRTPQTGAAFDPEVDTPVATGITGTTHNDTGLTPGDYDWQVFGRIPA